MNLKDTSSKILSLSIKAVVYVLLIVVLYLTCSNAFKFGKDVFSEEGMAKPGNGVEIQITVPNGASTKEVGDILVKNGLIKNAYAFVIQNFLYEGDIKPGKYVLNTEYNPEEIVEALKVETVEEDK